MTKCIQILLIAFGLMLIVSPLMAQQPTPTTTTPTAAAPAPSSGLARLFSPARSAPGSLPSDRALVSANWPAMVSKLWLGSRKWPAIFSPA